MLSERLDYIAALFEEAGVTHWFVSPGSRNAPIIASLKRNSSFTLYSFADERACAFAALGHALSHQFPAAFLCTSGSALANAYPAVLESYYQRVPLIIVSADRPEESIDQWDGQTIRQSHFFGDYARASVHVNARNDTVENLTSNIYTCIRGSIEKIPGPVHANIALSEPIYEGVSQTSPERKHVPAFVYKSPSYMPVLPDDISPILNGKKVMILVGTHHESPLLNGVLKKLNQSLPIFCDVTSSQLTAGFNAWDWALLKREIPAALAPEVLITMGMGIVSKPLKKALKSWKPTQIHVTLHHEIGDPFDLEPKIWNAHEADFCEALYQLLQGSEWASINKSYTQAWMQFIEDQPLTYADLGRPFSLEAEFMSVLFGASDLNDVIHLGNSMTVRYGSWAGNTKSQVFSNRGVSGIDGCLSTAIGYALAHPEKRVISILGDVSAVYDSNALWTTLPSNICILIYNNEGGRIFDFIEGPNNFEALRPFVHTPRKFQFEHLAHLYGIHHEQITIKQAISQIDTILTISNGPKLIELIQD